MMCRLEKQWGHLVCQECGRRIADQGKKPLLFCQSGTITKLEQLFPCQHRGKAIGAAGRCNRQYRYECEIHGTCTITRAGRDKACIKCNDRAV